MNQAQQTEADLSYFACLIDARSSLCVKVGSRLQLTIRLNPHQLNFVRGLATDLGFQLGSSRDGPYTSVVFLDAEVGKVFAQTHPHLRSARSLEYSKLAFRFWRTAQRRGINLTPEQRVERQAVVEDLKKLRAPASH